LRVKCAHNAPILTQIPHFPTPLSQPKEYTANDLNCYQSLAQEMVQNDRERDQMLWSPIGLVITINIIG